MKSRLLRLLRRKAKRNVNAEVYEGRVVITQNTTEAIYFRTTNRNWSANFHFAGSYNTDNLKNELNIARRDYIIEIIKIMRNQEIIKKLTNDGRYYLRHNAPLDADTRITKGGMTMRQQKKKHIPIIESSTFFNVPEKGCYNCKHRRTNLFCWRCDITNETLTQLQTCSKHEYKEEE